MTNAGDADDAKWPSAADWERFRTALRDQAFEEAARRLDNDDQYAAAAFVRALKGTPPSDGGDRK